MTLDAIVKHLDVFKDHGSCLLTSGKAVVMQAFCFERAKEALHRCIVPVAAFPAHSQKFKSLMAADKANLRQSECK
jgi:hypothetical protein